MYNFYPGPSRLYTSVKDFAAEAFESGILEKNHRSGDFMQLLEECIRLFRDRLNIPPSYKVFFTSSATECWEICAQSFLKDTLFYHNGAFGEKWKAYTGKITGQAEGCAFDIQESLEVRAPGTKDVCVVANETSNGTTVSSALIRKVREKTQGLVIIDAVSSLGGVDYDISQGDIWISSSQKCLGLPSGMGIMAVSPSALQRAREINDHRYYNSALFIEDNFDRFQTPYTPNILAIYLLKRVLEGMENVSVVAGRVRQRAGTVYHFLENLESMKPLIENREVRSSTVVAISCSEVDRLTRYLSGNGVTVGKGYGQWRESTFRIANFPAISDADFAVLFELLRNFAY